MTEKSKNLNVGFPLALRVASAGSNVGMIEGYASTYGGPPDHHDRIIAAGAFTESLTAHRAAGTAPAMLWSHDHHEPIGRWTSFWEDQRGLLVRGQVNVETSRGRDALAHVAAGDVGGLSIGWHTAAKDMQRNSDGTTTFRRAALHEVSIVAIPANPRARILNVSSIESQRGLERMLHVAGFSRAAAAKLASGGWPALGTSRPASDDRIAAFIERINAATLTLEGKSK